MDHALILEEIRDTQRALTARANRLFEAPEGKPLPKLEYDVNDGHFDLRLSNMLTLCTMLVQLRADAKPYAWSYDLAMTIKDGKTYEDWEPRISKEKPCVPEGSIRGLTPLYRTRIALPDREQLAEICYTFMPAEEVGEAIDGFKVTPGGELSWRQAKARDAEFAEHQIGANMTAPAYALADALLKLQEI